MQAPGIVTGKDWKRKMPKAFTERERARIRAALMDEGLRRFARAGVRALRIDELCRDVGIAKGSFYAFFASKEALFFALADAQDARHKVEMLDEMRAATGDARQLLGGFFDMVMRRLETDPLLRIVRDTSELAYIMRYATPEYLEENRRRDKQFLVDLATLFGARLALPRLTADALEGMMMLMLSLSLQEEPMRAAGDYPAAVALLRDMFLDHATKGIGDD